MTQIVPKEFLVVMAAFSAISAVMLYPSYNKEINEILDRQDGSALLTGSAVSVARALERGVFNTDNTAPVYSLHNGVELVFTPITITIASGKRIATAGPLDRRACMTALAALLPNTLRLNNISVSFSGNPETFNWLSQDVLEGDEIYQLCESGGYLSVTEASKTSSQK